MAKQVDALNLDTQFPWLSRAGLIQFVKDTSSDCLKEISYESLTNGLVLELNALKPTYKELGEWLRKLRPSECPKTIVPQKLLRLINIIANKRRSLLKSKNEKNQNKLNELLKTHFIMPSEPKETSLDPASSCPQHPNETHITIIVPTEGPENSMDPPVTSLQPLNETHVCSYEQQYKKLCTVHNKSNHKIRQLQRKNDHLRKTVAHQQIKVVVQKKKYRNVQRINVANKRKIKALKRKTMTNDVKYKSTGTQANVKEMCQNCLIKESEIQRLSEELEMGQSSNINQVALKNGRAYTPEAIKCILALIGLGVSYSSVGGVIKSVLELTHSVPDAVPSKSTVCDIVKMRKPLNLMKIQEEKNEDQNTTLYSDETSKYGQSYQTFAVTNAKKETTVLGLQPVANKSSHFALDCLQKIVADINSSSDTSDAGNKIITNIKNTMSDRAATQKSFNELFIKFRESVLPDVIPNWHVLSSEEQCKCSEVYNFFCGLHLLVNAADTCANSLAQYEKTTERLCANDDSQIVQLVYRCSKAFARGGDEKNGVYRQFLTYLETKKLRHTIQPFKGNRFNILFHNSAEIFIIREEAKFFIQNVHGQTNKLLTEIVRDLSDEVIVSGLRFLGLLDMYLTGPLWHLLEKKHSILEMNSEYETMIVQMNNMDMGDFIRGRVSLFGVNGAETEKTKTLTSSSDHDITTQHISEYVIPDIVTLFERLLKDQLPGGIHFKRSVENQPESASTLCHNKIPESVFAKLDYYKHHKPSASDYTIESHIMHNFNTTQSWLAQMSSSQLKATLNSARKSSKTYYTDFRDRLQVIKAHKIKELKEKEDKIRVQRERICHKNEGIVTQMIEHGLWQSEEEVNQKMHENYTFKINKMDALKAQIRFRKNILQQKPSNLSLFAFSKNKKKLTIDELSANLKQLIKEAKTKDLQLQPSEDILVGNDVCHTFEEDHKEVKYTGKVISQVPGYRQWYNIVYDTEPDTVYTYKLMDDFNAGDLVIKTTKMAAEMR